MPARSTFTDVAMTYLELTRRRGTPLILKGPVTSRTPWSRFLSRTTRLPRNRPASRIRTVPGWRVLRGAHGRMVLRTWKRANVSIKSKTRPLTGPASPFPHCPTIPLLLAGIPCAFGFPFGRRKDRLGACFCSPSPSIPESRSSSTQFAAPKTLADPESARRMNASNVPCEAWPRPQQGTISEPSRSREGPTESTCQRSLS